jgi:autoinducer 2-degrading protein
MTVTCVYVKVKPEFVNQFIEATTANHLNSVKEQGNVRFDLIRQVDDTSQFIIYEAYETEDAAAAHKLTAHYQLWRDTVAHMMHEPRKGVKYNMVCPEIKR